MERASLPGYLTAGAGILTVLASIGGVLMVLGWAEQASPSDGLGAGLAGAVIFLVFLLAVVFFAIGVFLSLFGVLAVRWESIRAPLIVLGGYVGFVLAIVAWVASTTLSALAPVLGYGSLLFPPLGFVGGWLLSNRLVSTDDQSG